jgi:transcriptional regulator with XRE-family HTH domain
MSNRRKLTPDASPRHHFGSEVRRAREAAGMTLADLAAMVPCDPSTVSRIEAGAIAPDAHFATVCDEAFAEMNGWFSRFYQDSRDWNQPFAEPFRTFPQYEAEATALYGYGHALIPGLLQTEDYARAVVSRLLAVTDGEVTERVAARIGRQAILTRDFPPMGWWVIEESVLTRRIGSANTMYDALMHLAAASRRPRACIQVLAADAGGHVGLQGAFSIAEQVGARTTVYLEDIADGRVTDDGGTVAAVSLRFRWLQAQAMSPDASTDVIERIAEEQWSTP